MMIGLIHHFLPLAKKIRVFSFTIKKKEKMAIERTFWTKTFAT
jgi:hypothetical protein